MKINTVLVSVTNKEGIQDFIKGLIEVNPSLNVIASGGTAKTLESGNTPYTPLSEYTQFPECFGGRVKTLHPAIAGGILLRRGTDETEAKKLGIDTIDLVICNLYDFENATEKPMEELVEKIDIGGSTLIRSAVKNFVGVIVDPEDYNPILNDIVENDGYLTIETRKKLAVKAINYSANYECLLAEELTKRLSNQETKRQQLINGRKLRYGENPDQEGWVFEFRNQKGIAQAKILNGKQLSFNNYEDATLAYQAAQELKNMEFQNGFAIVKHGSICGYANGPTLSEAFEKAWHGDAKSAFGSVIGSSSKITEELVPEIKTKFIEVLIAPSFSSEFISWCQTNKPNLRLLEMAEHQLSNHVFKNISGGMLMQTSKSNLYPKTFEELIGKVATKKHPTEKDFGLYQFGIAAVNFAKSNAVAIIQEYKPGYYQVLGMGAGQPNRIDSLQRLAIPKAVENLKDPSQLKNCLLASDGFFPFDDSIRYAAKWGIKNCIQPGGSKKDPQVIETADELNFCMVMTGNRYFSH